MISDLDGSDFMAYLMAWEQLFHDGTKVPEQHTVGCMEPERGDEGETNDKASCCEMRRKIYVAVWDEKSPFGHPMLQFRFCPWCGAKWERTGVVQEAPRADHE
jgi:hypothetical protein